MINTWVVVESDSDQLSALLPRGFELKSPHLIAEAISLAELPWLAGRGYEMLMLSVPVRYCGKEKHEGRLEIVTWENCPDAILSGRDELGWNKVYADQMQRSSEDDGNKVLYSASWGGTKFIELRVDHGGLLPRVHGWRDGPLMHYRVFPKTGQWGDLEIEQITGAGFDGRKPSPSSYMTGTGSLRFHHATFEQLPTLCHIVNKLADLPIKQVVDAGTVRLKGWMDLADMRVIQ